MEIAATPVAGGSTRSTAEPHLDAWHSLISAHAALVTRIEAALGDEGLPPLSWYEVLTALSRAGEPGLRPRELCLHLEISKSGLTRLVDRIAAAGLIERRDCPADRRGQVIVLTGAGVATLRRMKPIFARAHAEAFALELSPVEARTLCELLERVRRCACTAD
jgi:DNA-binding MarR family transcriptional regulator